MKSQELSMLRDELQIRHRLLDSFKDQMQSEDVRYRTSREKELLDDSFRKDIYECIHPVKCVMNHFKFSIWADVPLGVIWGVLFYTFFSCGMGIWSIGELLYVAMVAYSSISLILAFSFIYCFFKEEDVVGFSLAIAWELCLAGGILFLLIPIASDQIGAWILLISLVLSFLAVRRLRWDWSYKNTFFTGKNVYMKEDAVSILYDIERFLRNLYTKTAFMISLGCELLISLCAISVLIHLEGNPFLHR